MSCLNTAQLGLHGAMIPLVLIIKRLHACICRDLWSNSRVWLIWLPPLLRISQLCCTNCPVRAIMIKLQCPSNVAEMWQFRGGLREFTRPPLRSESFRDVTRWKGSNPIHHHRTQPRRCPGHCWCTLVRPELAWCRHRISHLRYEILGLHTNSGGLCAISSESLEKCIPQLGWHWQLFLRGVGTFKLG